MREENKKLADFTFEQAHHLDLGHIGVTPLNAIKEFVDNSTSSYFDNRDKLRDLGVAKCINDITWDDNQMIIKDNAFGMNEEQFRRAIKPGIPPKVISNQSRNQYGLGLNYALATMGLKFEITTHTPGSLVGYHTLVDFEEVAKGNLKEVPFEEFDVSDINSHYTTIKISKLNKKFSESIKTGRTHEGFSTLKQQLSVIYNRDIRDGQLEIRINGSKIETFNPVLAKNDDGIEDVRRFNDCSFKYNNRIYTYSGWIGYLEKGSTKTDGINGFSLVQRNRAIMTFYRPTDLLGSGNNRALQRIVGEIFLDGEEWRPSFTKSSIDFAGGLEEAFIESLKNDSDIKYIIKKSRNSNAVTPITTNVIDSMKIGVTETPKTPSSVSKIKTDVTTSSSPVGDNNNVLVNNQESNIKEESEYSVKKFILEGKEYSLKIKAGDSDDCGSNAFVFKKDENEEYILVINEKNPKLAEFTSQKEKRIIYLLLANLVIAELYAREDGVLLTYSDKINRRLNQLLK